MKSASETRERFAFLDGVRAFAAIFVMLHHFYLSAYPTWPRNSGPSVLVFLMYGHLAVALFIVVSGASLTLAPARSGLRLPSMSTYIRRRAWRIIPPYWCAIVVSVIVAILVGDAVSTRSVAVHSLLLQDVLQNAPLNGAFWSIAVEWQIYFLFPLVLLGLRRAWTAPVVISSVIAAVAAYLIGVGAKQPYLAVLNHVSPQFFALFVMGTAAVASSVPGAHARGRARAFRLSALILASLAPLAALTLMGTTRYAGNLFWIDLIVGPALALVLHEMLNGRLNALRRVLSGRKLTSIGAFSYSVYLVHAPIMTLIVHFIGAPLHLHSGGLMALLVVVGSPSVLVLAYAFHVVAERPFVRHRSLRQLQSALPSLAGGPRRGNRPCLPLPRTPLRHDPNHAAEVAADGKAFR